MNLRIFLSILLFSAVLQTAAQPVDYGVELYNGEKYSTSKIILRKPLLKAAFIETDNMIFSPYDVAFYRNEQGLFANTKEFSMWRYWDFIPCIAEGNVNLYRSVQWQGGGGGISYGYMPGGGSYTSFSPGIPSRTINLYYNKPEQPLRKGTYRNLRADLSDNPQSMAWLQQHRKLTFAQYGVMLAGAGLIYGSIAYSVNTANQPAVGGMLAGLLMTQSFWLFENRLKPQAIMKAVSAYNTSY